MAKKTKPLIAVSEEDKIDYYKGKYGDLLTEEFKGEVVDKEITFPRNLGVEHPFDFKKLEDVSKSFGLLNGAVDKYVDGIIGDFTVEAKNENVQAIITSFIKDSDFVSQLRSWVREAILKGNGFMELDLEDSKVRTLNANHMFVERDDKGKIEGYNQWIGNLKLLSRRKITPIPFKEEQIAHLQINQIPGEAYGQGFVNPNLTTINLLMGIELDLHKLMSRKAGMPIVVKIGTPEFPATQADIDDFKGKLQFMNNKTEWVVNESVDMSLIDFKDIGKNLTNLSDHDVQMMAMGMQIPLVLMGVANIPEGLARAQSEQMQRNIISIQSDIEKIVVQKIFKPILNAQGRVIRKQGKLTKGFDEEIQFKWNLPGETEINKRLERVEKLLTNISTIDENYRRMLQKEHARLLGFEEEDIDKLRDPEEGLDDQKEQEEQQRQDEFKKNDEREKEEEIPQPEVPTAKPNATEMLMHGSGCGQQLSEADVNEMTVKEWVNLQEFEKFNYSDYLVQVLRQVKRDKFGNLLAKTSEQLAEGLLPPNEIEKLRIILNDGFRENQTIREIEKEISNNVTLNDRVKDGKLLASAKSRPNSIARTETVRLANQGLLNHYQDNKIQKVRFLAAISERTCPICEDLNSRVFALSEAEGLIPVHTMCRCTFIPVI